MTGALAGGVVLAVVLVPVGFASWRASVWFARGGDGWDRCLVALVVALGGTAAALTALGVVSVLHRWVVVATLAVAGLAGAALVVARFPDPVDTRATRERRSVPRLGLLVAPAFALLAAHFAAVGSFGRSTETDTLQYHVPNLGSWFQTNGILELPFTVPGFATSTHPSLADLLGAVWLVPTGSDELLYLANLTWLALGVLACASLAGRLGAPPATGALGGLAVLSTPLVVWTQAGTLNSDLAAAAGVVAALALGLRALDADSRRLWVLAGTALGLATASKYTAFVPAAAVVAALVLVAPRRAPRWLPATLAPAVVLLAPWLARNLLETGNPFFPLAGGPLEGADTPLVRFETSMLDHLLAGRGDVVDTWFELARRFYGPLVLVVPLALAVVAVRRRRTDVAVAMVVAVSTVGYLATPYTGGGDEGVVLLVGSQLRYALPAVLCAAALLGARAGRYAPAVFALPLAWNVVRLLDGFPNRPETDVSLRTVALGGVAVVVVAVATVGPLRGRIELSHPAALAAASIAVVAGGALTLALQDRPAVSPVVDAALATTGMPAGPVVVVHVTDARSLMGEDLDVRLIAPDSGDQAGVEPILDPDELDVAVAASPADLLAHDGVDIVTVPSGWHPDPETWEPVGRQGRTELFRRRP